MHITSQIKPGAMKEIDLNKKESNAFIDTGSDINAVRESFAKKLKIDEIIYNHTDKYKGAGGAEVKSNRHFFGELFIDDQYFSPRFRIVRDDDIPADVLIGYEFLYDVQLTMEKGNITVERIENKSENDNEANKLWCMAITSKDEATEVPKEVEKMIEDYKPKKQNIDSNVEMKIQLTDENPIHESLRRLPYAHREIVEKQIKEWIKDN